MKPEQYLDHWLTLLIVLDENLGKNLKAGRVSVQEPTFHKQPSNERVAKLCDQIYADVQLIWMENE